MWSNRDINHRQRKAGAAGIIRSSRLAISKRPEQIARLERLPMVRGLAPIGRVLLPFDLNSDRELRQAAAELHADMLLIYTLDTTFVVDDKALPLTVITLGLSPKPTGAGCVHRVGRADGYA